MRQNILFVVIATFLLFGLAELFIGYAYFQKNGRFSLSTLELGHYVSGKISRRRAARYIEKNKINMGGEGLEWGDISGALALHLFSEDGSELLEEFAARYETDFIRLKTMVDNVGAKLIILYIPAQRGKMYRDWSDSYFKNLALRSGVEYVEMSEQIDTLGYERLTFEPWNGHFSRYGHYVIAEALAPTIKKLSTHQSSVHVQARTTHFADAIPNLRQTIDIIPEHPYFVRTNSYGFRTNEEFSLDDQRQRVVLLGDSLIYGPYVSNEDTVSDMLQRQFPNSLFLNAGAAGYNIVHQVEMFEEKTQYVGPDLVILQLGGNDVYSMFSHKINEYDRHGYLHDASPIEEKHIKQIISRLNAEQTLAKEETK